MSFKINTDMTDPSITIAPATDEEMRQIREDADTLLLGEGSASVGGKLHLDDGTGTPPCGDVVTLRDGREWRVVAPAVYPPGHKDLCRYCVEFWRRGGQTDG